MHLAKHLGAARPVAVMMDSEKGADESAKETEAETLGYRQRLEKPAGGDLVLLQWSPTMDLLAATFADNSVRTATYV